MFKGTMTYPESKAKHHRYLGANKELDFVSTKGFVHSSF